MKRVRTADNWFGTPDVLLHGQDHKDPVPLVGEVVVLTGGVKARVESMGTISSKQDGYRGI